MLKKILLIYLTLNLLFLSLFAPFVKTTYAQSTWFRQGFFEWYNKVYDTNATPAEEIYGERYTAAQVEWIIYSIWAFIINFFLDSAVVSCIFGNIGTGGIDVAAMGACLANSLLTFLGDLLGLITVAPNDPESALAYEQYNKPLLAMVFEDRPLSGITYVRQKFNLVQEVHAQRGFGFTRLEFIQPLWRGARDISFFLMILAVVVMAFMIMFRVKISPQTVITVQSAIPKVVMGLILITFSYAIAGFMVDLVYVAIGLLAAFFDLALPDPPLVVQSGIFYRMMTEGIPFIGYGVWGLMLVYIPFFSMTFLIAIARLLGVIGIPFLLLTGQLMFLIITVILFILVLFITIKIMWMLIKTYVNVILLVIFGPFYIMGGAFLPSLGFGGWLKSLASHLSVFVITGAMFILSYLFLVWGLFAVFASIPGISQVMDLLNQIFNALGFDTVFPVNSWQPPLLLNGPDSVGIIFCFLSLSTLFLLPKVADIIKSLISGRPFSYGTAIGEGFGPALVGAGLGWNLANNQQMRSYKAMEDAALKAGTQVPLLYRSINAGFNAVRSSIGGRRR